MIRIRPSLTARILGAAALICGGLGQSCAPSNTSSDLQTAGNVTAAPPGAISLFGVGLSPRAFDTAGLMAAFGTAASVGQMGVVQVTFAWDMYRGMPDYPSYTKAYDWMISTTSVDRRDLFEQHGLKKAFWLNFLDPAHPDHLNLPTGTDSAGFADSALASAYIDECVWFADHFNPDYLAIGVEIDAYLAAGSPAERAAMLAAMMTARSAIKSAHPDAVVFVYFQYENVLQNDLWDAIAPFAAQSDVFAFSTYPSLPISGPDTGFTAASLPADYYAPIAAHLGSLKPIAFAEVGHPASASALFSGGTPQEQANFIDRFYSAVPAGTAFAVWTYLYDLDMSSIYPRDAAAYFGSMGLLRPSAPGKTTPGWNAWRKYAVGS